MIIGHMALTGIRPSRATASLLGIVSLTWFALGVFAPQFFPDRALLHGLPSALLVIAALAFEDDGQGNSATRLLTRLGDASYALYLLHPFVLRGLAVVAGGSLTAISPLLFLILGVTLSCIAAMIIWRWFEKPVTKALQGPKPL